MNNSPVISSTFHAPAFIYVADTQPPGPRVFKIGYSRLPAPRPAEELLFPDLGVHERFLGMVRVPNQTIAADEHVRLRQTMMRMHPSYCLRGGRYTHEAFEPLCGLLEGIALHYGQSD